MPIRVIATDGPTADCTQAAALIDGMRAEHLLADKGYDTDAIVTQAIAQKMSPVIPPKSTASYSASMTNTSTSHATWSKMLFSRSRAGGVSPHATQRKRLHSSPSSKSDALCSRPVSCDDSV